MGEYRNAFLQRALQGLATRAVPKCWYCDRTLRTDVKYASNSLERDHKHPKSRNGSDLPFNLVDACRACNEEKGDKTVDEYRAWLIAEHGRGSSGPMGFLAAAFSTSGKLRPSPNPFAGLFGRSWLFPGEKD